MIKWILIIADSNAKTQWQLSPQIRNVEEMDGLISGWERSFANIKAKAIPL